MKRTSPSLVVGLVAILIAAHAPRVAAQEHTRVKQPAVPGEQAPPADPGQNNFGGPILRPGPGGVRPPGPPRRPEPKFGTVPLGEIVMSDPFVYPDEKTRTYYLIGSGGRLYKSPDLNVWTGPYSVIDLEGTWMKGHFVAAPEIHRIGGRYYLAGTWNDHNHLIENVPRRYNVPTNQTQLLVADSPDGPFKPLVRELEFCLGPGDWDIIDGTLYQEDGTTYMVFVHEWTQIIDGTIASMPLSKDLTHRTAEPTTLFRASEAAWAKEMNSIGEATFGLKMPGWVTDGPQLFRTQTGRLGMLWSSWGEHRYAQGVAYSTSGSIKGPWVQEKEALKGDNSGHGMLFRTFDGTLLFIVHHAEGNGPRKPQIWTVDDSGDRLLLRDRVGLVPTALGAAQADQGSASPALVRDPAAQAGAGGVTPGRSAQLVDPRPRTLSPYFTRATAAPKPVDRNGFIQRFLLLEPINKPNRTNTVFTGTYVRAAFKEEYFPNQFTVVPKDGDVVKVGEQELRWHALDSALFNVKLFRFAYGLNKPVYGVLFWAVTVVNSPRELRNVRLAAGSNASSMWWVNGEEAVSLFDDRRMVMDDAVSKRLTLRQGKNVIRGAVINGPGMSDFCVRFVDENGSPIKDLTVALDGVGK